MPTTTSNESATTAQAATDTRSQIRVTHPSEVLNREQMRVFNMLWTGATVDQMGIAGWSQQTVQDFLRKDVRKRLGVALLARGGGLNRFYRIDRSRYPFARNAEPTALNSD